MRTGNEVAYGIRESTPSPCTVLSRAGNHLPLSASPAGGRSSALWGLLPRQVGTIGGRMGDEWGTQRGRFPIHPKITNNLLEKVYVNRRFRNYFFTPRSLISSFVNRISNLIRHSLLALLLILVTFLPSLASAAPNRAYGQIELLRHLQRKFASAGGHVSCERVLSGQGLVNIYEFLRDTDRSLHSHFRSGRL